MSRTSPVKQFFTSYTGRMLAGMLAIHTILVPLVFIAVLLTLQQDYQSQFINNARSESYLLANLISADPKLSRIDGIINDQLLAGQVAMAEYRSIDSQISKDFNEDFFFGQGGDDIQPNL